MEDTCAGLELRVEQVAHGGDDSGAGFVDMALGFLGGERLVERRGGCVGGDAVRLC